ncbi:MAG: lipopolysaccharide heptosyltransferase I [Gammaproteobacteria bacterium RIFCSPHIGHO2_12_FULL_41_15]|nr:MAG: lipopolysaccharide heptosyltransferase I [Gammaproteobacteria bacterium RIFCSPHIGHO2_12_FULL_41_15]
MRVLLVKLTSMGDLIHALPALTDAMHAIPNLEFDWIIDEAFAEVATWHPAVKNIITTAHRRWRKNWTQHWLSKEIPNKIKSIRRKQYDLIIDGQSNLKAGIVTSLCKGPKAGLDWHSARDAICSLVYQHKYAIDKQLHAVTRLRILFAKALHYSFNQNNLDFGIDRTKLLKPTFNLPQQYLFFVHNASWVTKLWPEKYWETLIQMATREGHSVVLPCGNDEEKARAERLATIAPTMTIALPKLPLSEVAYIAAHATAAVCVDTGLSHLVGAVGVPSINLYGATDSGLIGAPGERQIYLQSDFPCAPCYKEICQFQGTSSVKPACYEQFSSAKVWNLLQTLTKR